jgi:hypothetical protein
VPQTYELELIDKDHSVASDSTVELLLASSSVTWVVSDENRANNTLHLAESSIEIPVDGPEPPAELPPATIVNPPAPPSSAPATPGPCTRKRRRVTFKLPRKARRGKLKVTVNGRRAKARRRGAKLVVTLPKTRTGRAIVRVAKKRRAVLTRRVKTCR